MLNCDAQLYFHHHYSSLQCHIIFRNHSYMLIYCSRNISDYYQCWKQLCWQIIVWKPLYIFFFWNLWWIESSKEQHLFEIKIFCNIINIFTGTFDQFNASLLNKTINFIQDQQWHPDLRFHCFNTRKIQLVSNYKLYVWIVVYVYKKIKMLLPEIAIV